MSSLAELAKRHKNEARTLVPKKPNALLDLKAKKSAKGLSLKDLLNQKQSVKPKTENDTKMVMSPETNKLKPTQSEENTNVIRQKLQRLQIPTPQPTQTRYEFFTYLKPEIFFLNH